MKIGRVIIIMLTWSTNTPKKISKAIMAATTTQGASAWPVIHCTKPLLAPEKERICENVVAPTMMNKIMPLMLTVPSKAPTKFLTVSAR